MLQNIFPQKNPRILISGAGIAGQAMAKQLKAIGISFDIIERRRAIAVDGAGIALPANGLRAMRHLGYKKIDEIAHQVNEIRYTKPSGELLSKASLLEAPLSVDKFMAMPRSRLNALLAEGIEGQIHYGSEIVKLDETGERVKVLLKSDTIPGERVYDAVIGADGIRSQVRSLVFGDEPRVDHGVTNWRWLCEYPTESLEPTYMLGAQDAFMAYPCGDNQVYCYVHTYDPANQLSEDNEHTANIDTVLMGYGGIAQSLQSLMPKNSEIISGRLRSAPKAVCSNDKNIALIGDACSACSPMLQQGATSAFEDIIVLSEFLAHFSIQDALRHYKALREPRAQGVLEASDTPLKAISNVSAEDVLARDENIRANGPLNVRGWRQLFQENIITEVDRFIQSQETVKCEG